MRAVAIALVGVVFASEPLLADEASAAIIKKAIEAHGGADNLRKALSVRGKAKRTYQEVIRSHALKGWRLVQIFAPAERAHRGVAGTLLY